MPITKANRNKMLIKMVRKIGIVNTAKELGIAKSTVSELYSTYTGQTYRKFKRGLRVRLSTGALVQRVRA